jgi:uncharacterized Tic20 family protein
MATALTFDYTPDDYESERASNGYLMSVVAVIVGLPLPIINLLATSIFYLNNRKGTYFVRWHCTQALLSQALIVAMNSVGFYWTMSIIFRDKIVDNSYVAYILTILTFNLFEFIVTVYAATQTRKGKHVELWLFGPLTNLICKG